MKYTHSITFYKKIEGQGWKFSTLKTTESGLRKTLKHLYKQQNAGTIRMIDAIKLRD